MNLESAFLRAVLSSEGALERASNLGIGPSSFDDPKLRRAYEWALGHLEEHKATPSPALVEDVCRVELEETDAEVSFLISEMLKKRLFALVAEVADKAHARLRANDPEGAAEALKEFAQQDLVISDVRPDSLFDLGQAVLDFYREMQVGQVGISLPWPTMNKVSGGLLPGTSTYFVARPGVGKTFVAVIVADHAWRNGERVLLISPEMDKVEIAERYFVTRAKIPSSRVISGQLSDFELSKIEHQIREAKKEKGIWILDSTDGLSQSRIESAIRTVNPSLVVIDAIYRLAFGGDRSERTVKAVDWISKASKRFKIPFLAFHQLSRLATRSSKHGGVGYDAGAIALTDQLLWDAHTIYIMEQDRDMKADKRMKFHVAKVRRGSPPPEPIECVWDLDGMVFEEIGGDDPSYEDRDFEGAGDLASGSSVEDEIPF